MENGEAMSYALNMIQERGRLMVEPGDAIYSGMIVGENARENDIPVNPCKAKKADQHAFAGATAKASSSIRRSKCRSNAPSNTLARTNTWRRHRRTCGCGRRF